jgi:hypothetical protein
MVGGQPGLLGREVGQGDAFLVMAGNHKQPLCDRVARDPPVSPVVSKRTVDLRCFLDDLALWARADRPSAWLLFPAGISGRTSRCLACRPTPTMT